jgi:hypothetical protein
LLPILESSAARAAAAASACRTSSSSSSSSIVSPGVLHHLDLSAPYQPLLAASYQVLQTTAQHPSAAAAAAPAATALPSSAQSTTPRSAATQHLPLRASLDSAAPPGRGDKAKHSSSMFESADARCVVCRVAARKVGLVHGDEMCLCLCSGCAACGAYGSGGACPLCGQPVQEQLEV